MELVAPSAATLLKTVRQGLIIRHFLHLSSFRESDSQKRSVYASGFKKEQNYLIKEFIPSRSK